MVSGQLIVCGTYSSAMSPSVCVEALEMMGENTAYTHCLAVTDSLFQSS